MTKEWVKEGSTWHKETPIKPVVYYDPRDQEFVMYLGENMFTLPLHVVKDLLEIAQYEIWRTQDIERFRAGFIENQDKFVNMSDTIDALREELRIERQRTAPKYPRHMPMRNLEKNWRSGKKNTISPENAKLIAQALSLIDARDKIIENMEKALWAEQERAINLEKGMAEIITAAQKEIARLKEKCGEA